MSDNRVKVVMYHYVRKIKDSKYPGIKGLEFDLFREQIAWLIKNFSVITIDDALEQFESNKAILPENACLLTFDDGYSDHYEYVLPILKKYGVQGSFFIPAKTILEKTVLDVNKIHFILAIGDVKEIISKVFNIMEQYRKEGWKIEPNEQLFKKLAVTERFDTKEVVFVKRLLQNELPEQIRHSITSKLFQECVKMSEEEFSEELYLNMGQIQYMKECGMYIGPHGYQHYWLGEIKEEEMQKDIDVSLNALASFIDSNRWVMNYPYGSYNQAVIDYIKKKGCKMAFSTEVAEAVLNGESRYTIPRFDTNDFPPKSMKYKEYL